jgi:hypothetical protein
MPLQKNLYNEPYLTPQPTPGPVHKEIFVTGHYSKASEKVF